MLATPSSGESANIAPRQSYESIVAQTQACRSAEQLPVTERTSLDVLAAAARYVQEQDERLERENAKWQVTARSASLTASSVQSNQQVGRQSREETPKSDGPSRK